VHVVSRGSISDAAGHAETCDACDITAPRANLVLTLDAGSERDWVGSKVTIGAATLEVVREPKHCLGIYADVAVPGTVQVGDDVEVG
jgi:hypothetical protein